MNIRAKLLIVFGATFTIAIVATYVLSQRLVLASFETLERDYATTNVTRVQEAIEEDLDALKSTCGDWAAWDDTRDFLLGKKETFVKDNLQDSSLVILRLNFMVFFDTSGSIAFSKCVDLEKEEETPLTDTFRDALLGESALFRHADAKDATAAIVVLAGTPVALAARPISGNDFQGDIVGTLIIGRHMDGAAVKRLADRTKLALTVLPAQDANLPDDFVAARDKITASAPVFVTVRGEASIAGYGEVLDITGKPCLLLRVEMPRDIYARGVRSSGYFVTAILVTGAALAIALLLALQTIVLGPLSRVSRHFRRVGENDDMTARLALARRDEIGALATEFDRMVEKLGDARRKLAEQSYSAGMAEMASGVLHNVRNSLTPVTAEIGNLCHKIRGVPLAQIAQARTELAEGTAAPDRREALGKFLDLAIQSMESLIRDLGRGLERIETPVAQIEHILTHEERQSRAEQPLETFSLETLVKDAIALVPEELGRGIAFQIEPSLSAVGSVKAQRLTLIQVFANVLVNAAEAIKEAKTSAGEISVRVVQDPSDGSRMLHVEVDDNGCGIDADTLPKLFRRGFSTKDQKHGGIGLHWCANALNAFKGSMRLESQGTGKGARCHVVFPVHAAETVSSGKART